jgi:hypothetical protein
MVTAFAILLVVHGAIHLLGTAKAFHWANLPQLTQPISVGFGALWLVASLLFLTTAASLFVWPHLWWAVGAAAVVLSMLAIVPSWTDAKVGMLANAIVVAGVGFGFLSQGPYSLRAEYDRDVEGHAPAAVSAPPVTDADLAHLPAPVQRYLRLTGVVGKPRVRNFRVTMHGRIRNGPQGRWMPLVAEQYNVVHPATRLFYLDASMFMIPAQGYHRYVGTSASMRVKAAALVPLVTAAGSEMTRGETVTMLNDMCIMAPATLIEPSLTWEEVDGCTARASFSNAGHAIRAELSFNEAGELTNFVSDDRFQASADGTTMKMVRWSTPIRGYRTYGAMRLPSGGQGRWHDAGGEFAYIELTIDDVQYNVQPR